VRNRPPDNVNSLVQWSRLLIVSLAIAAFVATGVILSSPAGAATVDSTVDATYLIPAAGDDAADDPFGVSDNQLAVAIFLPGFFVALTLITVVWAVKGRVKSGDDGDADIE
jgi:hypothetical protein